MSIFFVSYSRHIGTYRCVSSTIRHENNISIYQKWICTEQRLNKLLVQMGLYHCGSFDFSIVVSDCCDEMAKNEEGGSLHGLYLEENSSEQNEDVHNLIYSWVFKIKDLSVETTNVLNKFQGEFLFISFDHA